MRYFNFWTFPEFSVFSQIPGIYPYIPLFSFSHFLSPSSNASFANWTQQLMRRSSPCCIKCLWANSTQIKTPMLFRPILPTQSVFLERKFIFLLRLAVAKRRLLGDAAFVKDATLQRMFQYGVAIL